MVRFAAKPDPRWQLARWTAAGFVAGMLTWRALKCLCGW